MSRELIVRPTHSPLLEAYCHTLTKEALATRKRYVSLTAQTEDLVNRLIADPENEHLNKEVKRLRLNIRNLQTGIASTDMQEPPKAIESLTDSEKVLLRSAYRKCAQIAHPDKGGSKDEFDSVFKSYEHGDLNALIEFHLLKTNDKSVFDRIEYWKTALDAPKVAWEKHKQSAVFTLYQMVQQGRSKTAMSEIQNMLQSIIRHLLEEERALILKRKSIS